jgi:hypothetical protein
MTKAGTLYGDALELLDLAMQAPSIEQRVMLLSVAVCIRDHARDRFSGPSDPWPPSEPPARPATS